LSAPRGKSGTVPKVQNHTKEPTSCTVSHLDLDPGSGLGDGANVLPLTGAVVLGRVDEVEVAGLAEDFARRVAGGLEKVETDFETRRQIIDLLDVRVTLAIEDGQKVVYIRCPVDEAEMSSIESSTSQSGGHNRQMPFALTARIVLDLPQTRKGSTL
jgi:hypothetical protein